MENDKQQCIKINLAGGVISAGDLYEILIIAEKAGARHIRIGNRQQLYFNCCSALTEYLQSDMLVANIDYEINEDLYPNIVSSYIADGLFNHENWLKQGVYKDLLDLFEYQPLLKINVLDCSQTFVPFFTGNLNFISSDVSNYWYLYVRYPKTNQLYCWPALIYSEDIPLLSKRIEEVILSNKEHFYDQPEIDSKLLYQIVTQEIDIVAQQFNVSLKVPEFNLPPYEGMNKYGNKYWLGIYRRDELFPIAFLKELCSLCIQTRVGQVYISTWKSILIKNIDIADKDLWTGILSKGKISLRHSANELNWQLEELCDYCLDLKQRLVKEFDAIDLVTDQLSFAIRRKPKSGLFGSILLREQKADRFEIIHTRDFNPHVKDFIVYKQNVRTADLMRHLILLCHEFAELQNSNRLIHLHEQNLHEMETEETKTVHQCKHCLTIYDEEYGDDFNGIIEGTAFESLSEYSCPTCEAGKADFIEVKRLL